MSLIRNVSLVREASQPHVYFVCGGAKMWIPDPAEFDSMGFDWGKIQVVPDGTLNGYLSKPFVAHSAVKPSSVHFDVGPRLPPTVDPFGNGSWNDKSSRHIVQHAGRQARNVMLAGWLWERPYINIGVEKGEKNERGEVQKDGHILGVEDVFFNIVTWEVPGPAVCASNPFTPQWDIFMRGWDDAIYYRWFNALPATPWKSLSGTFNSDPAVAAVSPTVMYVFARGTDEAIWFSRVELTNTGSSAANWQSMGGEFTSSPAACALAPNQIFVFARGRDRALWYTRFTGQSWDNWKSLGGVLTSDPAAVAMRDPAAVPARDLVEVFVRGTDESLYHLFLYPDGTPSPWERIEGYWTSAPAVCSPDPANYGVDLFARGSDNAMWHRRRDGLNWQPWHSLGGALASDPAAVCSGGRTYVFARGTDEKLWYSWLTATQTGPWQPLAVELPPEIAPPPPSHQMLLSVEPTPTPTGQSILLTIKAIDAATHAPVAGQVHLFNFSAGGVNAVPVEEIFATNTAHQVTLEVGVEQEFDPQTRRWLETRVYPYGFVQVAGYGAVEIPFNFR